MKKIILIIVIIVLLIGSIVFFVFYSTRKLPNSADDFLTLIKNNQYGEAYRKTSKLFQSHASLDQFGSFISQYKLGEYQSSLWNSRKISGGNTGTLSGSITLTDHTVMPVQINFVKEENDWKIASININGNAGDISQGGNTNQAQINNLVNKTMGLFSDDVNSQDFTKLYDSGATAFKEQMASQDTIKKQFQSFIDLKVDLSDLKNQQPVFSEQPGINKDGLLVAQGQYTISVKDPTDGKIKQGILKFNLKYFFEAGNWKLFGIGAEL